MSPLSPPLKKERRVYLDGMRGIAALMVVFSHYAGAFYPATTVGKICPSHTPWEHIIYTTPFLGLVVASHFAVCMFFILSGYVLSLPFFGRSAKGDAVLIGALVKRPIRLAGLVIFSVLMSLCLQRFPGFYNAAVVKVSYSTPWFYPISLSQSFPGFLHLAKDLFFNTFAKSPNYDGPLWTLELEFYGSLLTFIFVFLFRRSSLRLVAYALIYIYFRRTLYQGFIFGIIFADITRNRSVIWSRFASGLLPGLLLLFGLIAASYPAYVVRSELVGTFFGFFPIIPGITGGYSMIGAILIFISVMMSARIKQFLSHAFFAFLGKNSFALYAVHFLILESFSSWLFLHWLGPLGYAGSFFLMLGVSIPLLLILSGVVTKYVDGPTIQLANFIGSQWEASLSAPGIGEAEVGARAEARVALKV